MLRIAARRNAGQSFRSVSMDLRSTNLNENPGCLVGQGFGPAAGLPPGVVWDGDAPGETTRTRFFRGATSYNMVDKRKATGYSPPMKIRSFTHKGLKRLYEDGNAKGVSPDTVDKLRKMFAFHRRPERYRKFERYAQSPADVHDQRRARNLRPEFRGLPLTRRDYEPCP
jgi:hypothetical protein